MSLTFGFYNSLNGDRKYDATHFSQIFDGIINDGVFMSVGDALMVSATEGMAVKIGIGRAWFNSTWTYNDAPMLLEVDSAEALLNRIDAVVLEINATQDTRVNSIKIVKGTPSTSANRPGLINDDYIHQYPLAYISVRKGISNITQANITNMVGSSACPFVTGILETMDIDSLIAQWQSQFDEWNVGKKDEFELFMSDTISEIETWKNNTMTETEEFQELQEDIFVNWFRNLQYQLSGDVAGNLQNQIDNLAGYTLSYVMEASKWIGDTYPFEDDFSSDVYNIEIEPSDECELEQLDAWAIARIIGSHSTNNCKAYGDIPTIDIPIIIKVVTK